MLRRVLDLLSSWGNLLGCGKLSKFGSRVLYVSCGVFGVRGMLGTLKM
jgi:hypothetical protein